MTLPELAKKYKTDKLAHGYCEIYEKALAHLRDRTFSMLEIGVFQGASIRMWLEYFPHAFVYGLDNGLFGKTWDFPKDRTRIFIGDQSARQCLRYVMDNIPQQLAFILDDGGHRMWDQQVSLGILFAKVRPGGLYIVEDLYSSFQPLILYNLKTPKDSLDYGWASGSDFPLATTHDVLSQWPDVKSPYLTDEEWEALVATVDRVEVVRTAERSLSALVFKKGTPDDEEAQA